MSEIATVVVQVPGIPGPPGPAGPTGEVPGSRAVNAGAGITGGGNLTADRTLALTGQALALHNVTGSGMINRATDGTIDTTPTESVPMGGQRLTGLGNATDDADALNRITADGRYAGARADVASATTTDIGAATSAYVRITGTTTITGLGTADAGVVRDVLFGGALTLTHDGTSLILPSGANIVTAAGDTALFRSESSGNWRCMRYQRASGAALVNNAEPVSTASSGVGEFLVINVTGTGALPSGGTWSYAYVVDNGSGVVASNAAGVAAGGSTIFSSGGSNQARGWAKRVA